MLRCEPSIPTLLSFYHKWVLDCYWILFLHLLILCDFYASFCLCDVSHLLTWEYCTKLASPGINPTWSWCMTFLMYCWIWFANILLRIFASMFDVVTGLQCLQQCGWDETNSHGLPSLVEVKGWHGHSLKGRAPRPLPWQAFIAFLGTLHWGWSSFTMHRFTLGGYLLQKTKERVLLITSKRKDICKLKGKVVEMVTLLLRRFIIDFRKLL